MEVTRWTLLRQKKKKKKTPPLTTQHESPPPPKWLHIADSQANPSMPSLDPSPALNLLQPPGYAVTEASFPSVDSVPLNLHAQTHRSINQSDDEDSEDALEVDAVEAADSLDQEYDESWDGEVVAMEGEVDPREGIVSDWDLLAVRFIAEAEELGKFEHSLLQTRGSLAFLCPGEFSISDHDLNILLPFGMKIAKTRSHVRALARFEPVEFACCINSCICYTALYADLDKCPNCKTSRLNESGRARRMFLYMPLIPRLRALMSNRTYATRLQYRADEHAKSCKPGTITDISDGLLESLPGTSLHKRKGSKIVSHILIPLP